jgi:hypothetical protein
MSTFYYAEAKNGDYLFGNLPEELKHLIASRYSGKDLLEVEINKEKKQARIGKKSNDIGVMYAVTIDPKYIKRYKLFKELLDTSILALKPLYEFRQSINDSESQKTREFIHNLTALNSYSIQQLFALIPQEVLTQNINKQSDTVKDIIASRPNIAVQTLLKLIKFNLATKVEFSVFERTQTNTTVQKSSHSIREIILSVLQIFMEDFDEHRIEVALDACEKRLDVDYDSLFVSLFYLFDNAIKYCLKGSKFKIQFREEQGCFSVFFIMISIKILPNEIASLSISGWRSDSAQKLNQNGSGIGMYRIKKTLRLNNAELEVIPRCNSYEKIARGIHYEGNLFKIKFLGQQNWFKF